MNPLLNSYQLFRAYCLGYVDIDTLTGHIECPGIKRPELRLTPEYSQPTKGHNMSTNTSNEVTLEELPQPKSFIPVKLTVTLNTAEEFTDFYHRMNMHQSELKNISDGTSSYVPDAPASHFKSASSRVFHCLVPHAKRLKLRG